MWMMYLDQIIPLDSSIGTGLSLRNLFWQNLVHPFPTNRNNVISTMVTHRNTHFPKLTTTHNTASTYTAPLFPLINTLENNKETGMG